MIRTLRCLVLVALLAACSNGVSRPRTTLYGGSCAKPEFALIPSLPTLTRAVPGTATGIHFLRGRGWYVVDEAFVEVLRPDAEVDPSTMITEHRNPAVLTATVGSFAAADRDLTVVFGGVDSQGRALPPGRYPVVFSIASHSDGKCPGVAGVSGEVTTLDWRG